MSADRNKIGNADMMEARCGDFIKVTSMSYKHLSIFILV